MGRIAYGSKRGSKISTKKEEKRKKKGKRSGIMRKIGSEWREKREKATGIGNGESDGERREVKFERVKCGARSEKKMVRQVWGWKNERGKKCFVVENGWEKFGDWNTSTNG